VRRILLLLAFIPLLSFGQAIQPTDNPNQINVSTGWLYLNKMHFAGAWASTTTYNNQDVVTYLGQTYLSNGIGNLGVNPASSTIWWTPIGGGGSGSGTVTSVGITVPAWMSAGGTNPVTTNGTIAITANAENANLFFGGPASGSAAAPSFRALVAADLPTIAHAGIAATAVTPGSYTCSNITVQADGSLTAAANGSCSGSGGISGPGTTVSGYVPQWSNTLGTALGAGLAVTQTGAASSLTETDASGNLTANAFFTNAAGAGYLDMTLGASPGNPASGKCRMYGDSTAGTFLALTSAGANCFPSSIPATTVQTNQSNAYTTGTQDFSLATHLVQNHGTAGSKPATCTIGETYFATDATPGVNWYFCTATNTWTQQSTSGGSGPATSLVDGGGNTAMAVIQGTGTIVNDLTVQDAPTTVNPQLAATGTDTNINLQLTPKGSGYVYVPATGITTGANSPPLVQVGASGNSGGSIYGVMEVLNAPSATGANTEALRIANNGAWSGSLLATGSLWLGNSGELDIGGSASGNTGRARINNTAEFLGYASGFFGLCSSASSASSCDVGLARTGAGEFEINGAAVGGQAAANIRDLKLRHEILSGTAPTITSGFGTSPSIAGSDGALVVTVGTGGTATTGTITFGTAWTNAPVCVANDATTILAIQPATTTTTVALTVATAFGAADKLSVICQGY
jgi:hypothetical protein